jgi:excisionase family DNA binding protein
MAVITTKQAATKLSLSVKRVQALIKAGRLPAALFGGVYAINEKDLALVKDRKPGRPKKAGAKKTTPGPAAKKGRK